MPAARRSKKEKGPSPKIHTSKICVVSLLDMDKTTEAQERVQKELGKAMWTSKKLRDELEFMKTVQKKLQKIDRNQNPQDTQYSSICHVEEQL